MIFLMNQSVATVCKKNQNEVKMKMNRMLTSIIAIGAGVAAYNYARKNNMISNRQMKRLQRRVSRALF